MSRKELFENKLQMAYSQMTISDLKKISKNIQLWMCY